MRVMAGALGDCVHVAGVSRFLAIAEQQGHETLFTGPATDIESFVDAIHDFNPDIVGVSYRLTPENARLLIEEFWGIIQAAGLDNRRFVFGGTPPVADIARELGGFEAIFDGSEAPGELIRFLRGEAGQAGQATIPPQSAIARIQWKAPYPILRHHFGIPAFTIAPTVAGIAKIAEAGALDVISLGADQDAQEHFFRPDLQNPKSKGAGGVPFRSEEDLMQLREAAQCGNYPLLRSYSGTADLLRYADMLKRVLNNAWCATSLFFFNAMDGRGPQALEESIRDHLALMAWHGERNIPVEGNEPYHWGMRDAPDVISVASSYLYAYNAKKAGVRDYITTYMFESPNTLSNRMDLAKALAQIKVAEAFADADFRIWRQTRTGLLSYPVDAARARAHLAESIYMQMALRPSILHIVGYTEAHHAATAEEVIESSTMAQQVIETALYGQPDMTTDPVIQARVAELVEESAILIEAIRQMGADAATDPLSNPQTLARAVQVGLLDAPQLKRNPFARGEIRTRAINGAILAVDAENRPLSERQRLQQLNLV